MAYRIIEPEEMVWQTNFTIKQLSQARWEAAEGCHLKDVALIDAEIAWQEKMRDRYQRLAEINARKAARRKAKQHG